MPSMNRLPLFASLILVSSPIIAHAATAQAWAPGVSASSGWYDYNKAVINDGAMADTAMCWAASSSNLISWWQNLNGDKLTGTTLPPRIRGRFSYRLPKRRRATEHGAQLVG